MCHSCVQVLLWYKIARKIKLEDFKRYGWGSCMLFSRKRRKMFDLIILYSNRLHFILVCWHKNPLGMMGEKFINNYFPASL